LLKTKSRRAEGRCSATFSIKIRDDFAAVPGRETAINGWIQSRLDEVDASVGVGEVGAGDVHAAEGTNRIELRSHVRVVVLIGEPTNRHVPVDGRSDELMARVEAIVSLLDCVRLVRHTVERFIVHRGPATALRGNAEHTTFNLALGCLHEQTDL